jgi:antitoxin HigA-1
MRTTSRSSTTTRTRRRAAGKFLAPKAAPRRAPSPADSLLLPPVHPGEVLEEEFLIPLGLSAYRVATDIGVPPPRINDIVLRRRAITADTALRLSRYFGTSAKFWLGLQMAHDLDVEQDRLAGELEKVSRFDRESAPIVRRPRQAKTPTTAKKGSRG